MEKQNIDKEVDIHLLDLRYAHTRVQNQTAYRLLRNSIERFGQLVPALAVEIPVQGLVLIDGYLRVQALQACGRDLICLNVLQNDEQDALFLLLTRCNDRQWEVIEQAAMIAELHHRFGCSFGVIGQRLGHDKSWVKRRLDLVESLPDDILQAVMAGNLSSWSASRVMAPLARANAADAQQLMVHLMKESMSTRELVQFYEHYQKSNRITRTRMLDNPGSFIKVLREQSKEKKAQAIDAGPEGRWLKDITIIYHMLKRLIKTSEQFFHPQQETGPAQQRQIWIKQVEKLVIELKELSRRVDNDNLIAARCNSRDAQERGESARNIPDSAHIPQCRSQSSPGKQPGENCQAIPI